MMKVNVLKRLATTSKVEREYSSGSQYSCEIKFPTIGSGMNFLGAAADYDFKGKTFCNQISLGVYSSGNVYFAKDGDPLYEKKYEENLDDETQKKLLKLFENDRKEFKNIADQINKIYEEAGKKVEAVLKKAGYSKSSGGRI